MRPGIRLPGLIRHDKFNLSLRSGNRNVPFDTDVDVKWTEGWRGPRHPQPQAAVRHHMWTVVEKVTAEFPVTCLSLAQNAVRSWLGTARRVPGTNLRLVWAEATLAVDPELERMVRETEAAEREAEVEKSRLAAELSQLRYLRDNILADPGMARSYLFKQNPKEIRSLVGPEFEELAEKIGSRRTDKEVLLVAEAVTTFLRDLDRAERQHLSRQLLHVFRSYGREDLAARFDPPPPDDPAGGDGTGES